METNFDDLLKVAAVPQDDEKAAFIAESRRNREQCYEWSQKMTEAVAESGAAFRQYLDVQSQFDRYAPNNVLLIMAQNPEATKIGNYGYWKDRGIYIKRSERDNPILIMEPGKEYTRDDGTRGTYYNAKKMYDISQTTAREQEQTEEVQIEDKKLIRAVLNEPPVEVMPAEADQMPADRGAVFEPAEQCIYVRKGMDAQEIFKNVIPELVHAGMADGDKNYDRDENAFHAYYATYLLCKKYGVDTKDFDFSDTAGFFDGMEPAEVRGELKRVHDAAEKISAKMVKVLDMDKKQKENAQESGEKEQTEEKEAEPEAQKPPKESRWKRGTKQTERGGER